MTYQFNSIQHKMLPRLKYLIFPRFRDDYRRIAERTQKERKSSPTVRYAADKIPISMSFVACVMSWKEVNSPAGHAKKYKGFELQIFDETGLIKRNELI